jgi:hypothetical protein
MPAEIIERAGAGPAWQPGSLMYLLGADSRDASKSILKQHQVVIASPIGHDIDKIIANIQPSGESRLELKWICHRFS